MQEPTNNGIDITAQRRISVELNGVVGTNRSFQSRIRTYKTWVDRNRDTLELGLHDGVYTNITALKKYWLTSISKNKCNSETAKQVRQALDQLVVWEGTGFAPMMDHPDIGPTIQVVFDALDTRAVSRIKQADADPHDDVPVKTINLYDLHLIMENLLKCSDGDSSWKDRGIVWSLLSNTMLRWKSGDCLRLPNLYVFKKLPPRGIETPHDTVPWGDPMGDDSGWMLTFIVPPIDQRKKNQKISKLKTEVVGAYWHKTFLRCLVGIVGFKLFEDLNTVVDISFWDDSPQGTVFWGDVHLFEKGYWSTNIGMKKDKDIAGVEGGKEVTHLRKCAITLCTAQGLSEEQVTTMSKHRDNHFQRSYRAELSAPICTTLQGFLPNEPADAYYCPRAHCKLPPMLCDEQNFKIFMRYFWRSYPRWERELARNDKCKSRLKSAMHFLHEVIPWLTKVILQDAPFWIDEFPQNSAVILLLQKLTCDEGMRLLGVNFTHWARDQRRSIKEKVLAFQSKRLAETSSNATIIAQTTKIIEQNEILKKQNDELKTQLSCAIAAINQAASNNTNFSAQSRAQATNQVARAGATQEAPPAAFAINDRLNNGNNAVLPTIWTCEKYESVTKLVGLCSSHKHDVLLGRHNLFGKNGPLKTKANRWAKIKKIYARAKDHASNGNFATIGEAAIDLDANERREMNMNQYSNFIRDNFDGKYAGAKHKKQRT